MNIDKDISGILSAVDLEYNNLDDDTEDEQGNEQDDELGRVNLRQDVLTNSTPCNKLSACLFRVG